MRRFVVQQLADVGQTLTLDMPASHHIATVLRLGVGTSIDLTDGQGAAATCTILQSGASVTVRIDSVRQLAAERGTLTLLLSILKGNRWDWALEKCGEFGVDALVPIMATHCVVKLRPDELVSRADRWQRICDAGMRQSEGSVRCHVHPPQTLTAALSAPGNSDLTLFASERDPLAPWPLIYQAGGSHHLRIAVGPEGGWSPQELHALRERATPIGLGSHVLRAESAAVALMAMVNARRDGLL
jgi:16S rRNA (uracil1498-N3)-methyltransferase